MRKLILLSILLLACGDPLDAQGARPDFCPIAKWVAPCALLTDDMADRIRTAVDEHIRADVAECAHVRDVLYHFIEERGHMVWTFHGTVLDTRRMRDAANTVRDADGKAVGVGFRLDIMSAPLAELARIVIHEATHMADSSKDERRARRMESICVR